MTDASDKILLVRTHTQGTEYVCKESVVKGSRQRGVRVGKGQERPGQHLADLRLQQL